MQAPLWREMRLERIRDPLSSHLSSLTTNGSQPTQLRNLTSSEYPLVNITRATTFGTNTTSFFYTGWSWWPIHRRTCWQFFIFCGGSGINFKDWNISNLVDLFLCTSVYLLRSYLGSGFCCCFGHLFSGKPVASLLSLRSTAWGGTGFCFRFWCLAGFVCMVVGLQPFWVSLNTTLFFFSSFISRQH